MHSGLLPMTAAVKRIWVEGDELPKKLPERCRATFLATLLDEEGDTPSTPPHNSFGVLHVCFESLQCLRHSDSGLVPKIRPALCGGSHHDASAAPVPATLESDWCPHFSRDPTRMQRLSKCMRLHIATRWTVRRCGTCRRGMWRRRA